MVRKIFFFSLVVFPLVWSVPCHAAATYDATGPWSILNVVEVSVPGEPTFTESVSAFWNITQTSETPDDAFVFSVDDYPPWWHGHVSGNRYTVEGPLNENVSPPEMYSFVPVDGRWYYLVTEDFYFDLISGGTELYGEQDNYYNGWYFNEGDPDATIYYDSNMDGVSMYNQISGTLIPEPTTALLLGTGLAGLALRRRLAA